MNLELAAAAAKLSFYAAGGVAAGTALAAPTLHLPAALVGRRVRSSAALALLAATAGFFLLVLRLDAGLEWELVRAVLDGPAGHAVALQLAGGLLLLAGAGAPRRSALGALALLASFGASGHAADHGLLQAFLTVAHVAAAAWWLGGLLIVRAACAASPSGQAAILVRRFSRLALILVASLAATGAFLVWELVTIAGFETSYARTLLAKLLGVAAALAVAARSRLLHLPALVAGDPRPLRRTVTIELALLAAALAVTAWLTTFESPHALE